MPVYAPRLTIRRPHFALRALCLVGLGLSMSLHSYASDQRDHERARAAVQAGQVLPLAAVLERIERSHPGQVLEVELEQKDGMWIYELKLLTSSGQIIKLKLDARNAAVLSSKSRSRPADGQRAER
jgi:uncharacterized membrane protein YkoI